VNIFRDVIRRRRWWWEGVNSARRSFVYPIVYQNNINVKTFKNVEIRPEII